MRMRTAFTLAATVLGLAQMPSPAAAQKLTIAVGGAFTSLDPHYHNLGPNNALTSYVFEPQIGRAHV